MGRFDGDERPGRRRGDPLGRAAVVGASTLGQAVQTRPESSQLVGSTRVVLAMVSAGSGTPLTTSLYNAVIAAFPTSTPLMYRAPLNPDGSPACQSLHAS